MRFVPLLLAVALPGCTAFTAAGVESRARGLATGTADAVVTEASAAQPEPTPSPDQGRKVIHNGLLLLRVPDRDAARRQARRVAEEAGGWVEEEEPSRVRLRVPAAKFKTAMEGLAALGRVEDRRVKANDVTEEYRDLKLRLQVKERFLEELQQLYAKGGGLADLLTVKREIERVTEEIERLKGRIRYLTDRISMSRIDLHLQAVTGNPRRRFNLPFRWLDELGLKNLFAN